MTLVDERLAEARLEALEAQAERAERMIRERENAKASREVVWFWRGRLAGLLDALALFREDAEELDDEVADGDVAAYIVRRERNRLLNDGS
jgi:hypothetical protein